MEMCFDTREWFLQREDYNDLQFGEQTQTWNFRGNFDIFDEISCFL